MKNKTITDSFVYYYQPLANGVTHYVPCQTILIDPSTQEKTTPKEVDMLGSVASVLDELGFPVKGFALTAHTRSSIERFLKVNIWMLPLT